MSTLRIKRLTLMTLSCKIRTTACFCAAAALTAIFPCPAFPAAPTQAPTDEVNVALAANGATVQADSEWLSSSYDTGGKAPASRLIDGIIRGPDDPAAFNRWHSDLGAPHPHWIWIRFARPDLISHVTLCRADIGAPVDFDGQFTPDQGRTITTLFHSKNVVLDAAHPTFSAAFAPVLTDNFRLLIFRSSNQQFPNYCQLSELQVFGNWQGSASPAPQPPPAPARIQGLVEAGKLPAGLQAETSAGAVTFTSRWLKASFSLQRPGMTFLSLDASGSGRLDRNLLKAPQGADLVFKGWDQEVSAADVSFIVSRSGDTVRYSGIRVGSLETDSLAFTVLPRGMRVVVDRTVPQSYLATEASPLRMLFDAAVTPASPMGRLRSRGQLLFPVLLHFPDYGSLLVEASGSDSTLAFTGRRGPREVQLSLETGRETTREAASVQQAGHFHTTLNLQMTQVYPEIKIVDSDPVLSGVKRGWLNIFGFRPDIVCLSNNSLSDNCMFCMYEYADLAYYTPPLFHGFSALDLVRASLDSYFDGLGGYGGDDAIFVDTDPAMVIASWDYAAGANDLGWLRKRIGSIEKYADHIVAADVNGDGMAESTRTGISGSGGNGAGQWSSNWWDVISFGWNDAYGIALDYRAFRCAADMEQRLGRPAKAQAYSKHADQIKAVYYQTFYNPSTGVLAGWRSKDGQLHDYYFTFINGIAVTYGLVTREQGNAIMDRMQAKMREVGYTNFRIGLPGNLIPVARKDYAGGGVMGQPSKDDGSDSFQSYENGGATGSFAYFYIQALYSLGRKAEADTIFNAMLEGYRDGVFQNGVGSGVDWKRWDGRPCGYEGLLTDTYYALTALMTGREGKGVPIPGV